MHWKRNWFPWCRDHWYLFPYDASLIITISLIPALGHLHGITEGFIFPMIPSPWSRGCIDALNMPLNPSLQNHRGSHALEMLAIFSYDATLMISRGSWHHPMSPIPMIPDDSMYGHQRHFLAIQSAGIPEGQCLARPGCEWCRVGWAWVVTRKRTGLYLCCAAQGEKDFTRFGMALVLNSATSGWWGNGPRGSASGASHISCAVCDIDPYILYETFHITFVIRVCSWRVHFILDCDMNRGISEKIFCFVDWAGPCGGVESLMMMMMMVVIGV